MCQLHHKQETERMLEPAIRRPLLQVLHAWHETYRGRLAHQ